MASIQYITVRPERWDNIANMAYGNANLSEVLIKANPDVSISAVIEAGTILNLPILEIESSATDTELLPPWKR